MSVLAETSPSKMLGKRLNQSVGDECTRFPSSIKHPKIDAARTFPENCGQLVRQMEGSRIQHADAEIYLKSQSTSKRGKVDTTRNFAEHCGQLVEGTRMQCDVDVETCKKAQSTFKRGNVDTTRNFPQKCGPCARQMNGSGTQCSADGGIKSRPEVVVNAIAKPLRVFVPTNWTGNRIKLPMGGSCLDVIDSEAKANTTQIDLPTAKKDDLVETGTCTKEVGASSHLRTSCQQLPDTNENQPLKMDEKGFMSDELTQQLEVLVNQRLKVFQKSSIDSCNSHDKCETNENGLQLSAIVSQENLIEGRNGPTNDTSKRFNQEKIGAESENGEDDEEIRILSCYEWNSLKPSIKSRSASKKDDRGVILQAKVVGGSEPLEKCVIIDLEESLPEAICSEQHRKLHKGGESPFKDRDQYESAIMKKQIVLGVSRDLSSLPDQGLLTEDIQKEKVRETLKLFDDLYTSLLQEDKAAQREGPSKRQIHLEAATTLRDQGKWLNCGWTFGNVPGVEIGDQFRFRAELKIIGLHGQYIRGIHHVNIDGKVFATSVVDSGRYDNEAISSETIIYVGQGGNPKVSATKAEDQKLEGGNLALKNTMELGYPVRVIGKQRMKDDKNDVRYIYYGLYTVTKCWQERGPTGKIIFKFELQRKPDQPKPTGELVSKQTNSGKVDQFSQNAIKATESVMQVVRRESIVDNDVSQGKEKIPIPAFNAIDDERPPPFTYITKMNYPDWYRISTPPGCKCTSGCSDEKCACASRNGGEIPFNTRGAITKAKSLVYECGPSCKCPPSCNNRVSQHGLRYRLEVFKTESRGWGLRSRDYISSGSFICEYVGELLDEKEAEKRIDHDEYLFDVGNYDEEIPKKNDVSMNDSIVESNYLQRKDEDGFTLDAARYGNVGRFINHSCSPNLYAQNVMYDHGDRRVPHIMFFAEKKINPLEELTYHYNYQIDQVLDSNGNLKKKDCNCGSRNCEGRMY